MQKFDDFIQFVGFSKSDEDHVLFSNIAQAWFHIFLILYMQDMLLSGRHARELADLVRQLQLKFSMMDLGPTRHILGMKRSNKTNSRYEKKSASESKSIILVSS